MELLKETAPLEFKHGDVTFLVRAHATATDKLMVFGMGQLGSDGTFGVKKGELMELLVERFVVGWHGVTEDGKEVPFSQAALKRLPPEDDGIPVLVRVANFILDKTRLIQAAPGDLKKASREPSSGHAK